MATQAVIQTEVTVIGAGLAGMAAAIHLAQAGMQVLCVDADAGDSHAVGESLDWSAPELLKAIGLPMERLIQEEIATYKRHVTLKLSDGSQQDYAPSEWLGRRPWNIDLRTIHVNRIRLNEAVREIVLRHGVRILNDKAIRVEKDKRRITGIFTANDHNLRSPWYVDASGLGSCLFPRAFSLPVYEYGPRKVAIWNYFTVPESVEGTTLYADQAKPSYMQWIWEIPIHTNIVSVGYVAPGDVIKAKRQQGQSVQQIYTEQLSRFPRFVELMKSTGNPPPFVTSFCCRAHGKISGPNWLVVGEAAAMVDPMTSNGVTSALRHAAEASRLVIQARNRKRLSFLGAAMYNRRVLGLARFFNNGIERIMYDWPIRKQVGPLTAGDIYTIPAWTLNHLYSRIQPKGVISTCLFDCLLSFFRVSGDLYHAFCKRKALAGEVTS